MVKFNIEKFRLRFTQGVHNINEIFYTSEIPRSKAEIIKAIKSSITVMKNENKNYKIISCLKYDFGWRNSQFFNFDEKDAINMLYEPENHDEGYSGSNVKRDINKGVNTKQSHFNTFSLMLFPIDNPEGGNDLNNDCLYRCLKKLDKQIKIKPFELKKSLNLKRDDKIDISLINSVEKMVKMNINIVGDYSYISEGNYFKTANLTLIHEHYDLDKKSR